MKNKHILLGLLAVPIFGLMGCTKEQPSETLFTTVTPEQSNIYFNNRITDTEEFNSLLYANYYGGGGVAVGDINQDGLQDLYFTGNLVGDKLYLNKGGLEFENISVSAGISNDGGWSSGVLMGDVNGDGYTDIYVTREMYGNRPELMRNRLYLNNKDNTFSESSEAWGVDNPERSRGGTFIDYDNDGDLDLFLLNTPPNPGPLINVQIDDLLLDRYSTRLYENLGSNFIDVSQASGLFNPGFPNSVVAADFNGDGMQDLYVTNDFKVPDCMYINNGDGTFNNQINQSTGHISFGSMGVDAADINNDGLLDIFVTDMSAEDNYRIKANMGGMNPEAFWEVVNGGGHYQYMYNTLQLHTGYQKFSDIAQLAGLAMTDWSWSSFFADFDNDGLKDVFVANGVQRDIRNTDALNTLSKQINSQPLVKPASTLASDNDISIDSLELQQMLELFPSEKLLNYVFQNNGDHTFTRKKEEWGIQDKSFSNGTAYSDLDNDGDLDLIVNNLNDYAQILENHASDNGAHFLRVRLSDRKTNRSSQGAKLWLYTNNGMQYFEITGSRGMYSSSEQLAHFGLGENTKVEKLKVRWPGGKEQIFHDIPIDQMLEVDYREAVTSSDESIDSDPYFENITDQLNVEVAHTENEFNDYHLQVLLPHKMSTYGPGLATGDINGDGNDDFYLGGAAGYPGQLAVQNSSGDFSLMPVEVFQMDKQSEDTGAEFFDSDGDGDLDLFVVSGGNEYPLESEEYRDRLYINDGSGNFSRATGAIPDIRISGSKVRPGDFDNDQDLDLLITGHHIPGDYPTPASSTILKNENGRFTDVTEEVAPDLLNLGLVNDAVWVDVDNDQRRDLVLVGEWMPVTILKNLDNQLVDITNEVGLQESSGWWFSVAAADVDGDGDQDLIGGNLGLNYKYQASYEEPFEVYYHDFDLNGSKDIVLTYHNFGNRFPLRGRSCSSEQVPQLSEKFGTYDLFAQSDIESVYGVQNLDEALHYQSNTFASSYFENDGNGKFTAHPLPKEAQFSSVNDILVKDINQDDKYDIIIAGNLYNAEVETPRNDAGYSLVLQGKGDGNFEPIPARVSGLFLPYEVKRLALLSGAGGEYLVAGCNDEKVQVFRSKN